MNEFILKSFEKWLYPKPFDACLLSILILILLCFSWATVYYTGGTAFAYLHLFYIPIICAGFFFSIKGGIITGLLAGLMIGPFMPIDILQQIQQPTYSWATRLGFFILIGAVSGLGSSIFRQYLNELKEKYTTDAVTGLLNFQGLQTKFQELIDSDQKLGIVLIDPHNIGDIELAIGPAGVQNLIKQIASELHQTLPNHVILGHPQFSGFVLIIPTIKEIETIVNHCHQYLKSSYQINQIPIFIEMLFGIVCYPEDDDTFSGLIRKARMAIVQSAKKTRHITKYDETIKKGEEENIVLLNDLNTAIEEEALQIYYQPKIHLKTGTVIGVEALTRWFHPTKGEIPPNRFIPLLERTLLIVPFTKWLLQQTFRDMATWHADDIDLSLAVNFSMSNFHDRMTLLKISDLIEEFKLDPKKIEIEITESAFATDFDLVIKESHYLRDKGLRISIDDFGAGLASQQYLFELPVDGLKIDRIFIASLGQNSAADAIVQSAISLAHQLKLQVIAEGIETDQQFQTLVQMGCDLGQGYVIAKPMPYTQLMEWLRSPNKKYAV